MYTCPMHPEVREENPGRCPKCGMGLILASTLSAQPTMADHGLGVTTWKNYVPLFAIIGSILLIAALFSWLDYQNAAFSVFRLIGYFMTGFFLVFSFFKLISLKGFAEGYSTYDLLAQKVFVYGYVYPFMELGFGIAMLAGIHSNTLLIAEIAVMIFSGLGVTLKILKKEPVKCVCLGTFLKIPLTTVTLFEDFGMAALASILLLHGN